MSGFEIAGLVLGAIPLFISAAKQYREGLDSFDRFRKKEVILKIYIQELETHHTLLQLHLQKLVGSTDLPARVQQELVEKPASPLWHGQDVQTQFHRSLGKSTDVFLNNLQRIADIFTEQIAADDTLPGYNQACQSDNAPFTIPLTLAKFKQSTQQNLRILVLQSQAPSTSSRRSFADRVKFTWRSPKHNEILISLKGCNETLSRLIDAVEEARPYQKKQQVRKVHAAWRSRNEIQRLYEVLHSSCTCSHNSPHRAKLRIKPCTDDHEDDDFYCTVYDICFQQQLQNHRPVAVTMYRRSLMGNQNTGVRISVPNASHAPDRQSWKAVNDICSMVGTMHTTNAQVSLIIDEVKDLWQADQLAIQSRRPSTPSLSLEALYPTLAPYANKKWLIREKLILAIIASYSALQLYDSSWLPSGLSSDQLFFPEHGSNFSTIAAARAGNALGQPYISGNIQSGSPSVPTSSQVHRNINLLSLGVMLLELHLNQPLRSTSTSLGMLKLQAMDLLQDHYDDASMSRRYYEAVCFCLLPKPDESTRLLEFSDSAFREMYYRNVILPLEEELHEKYEVDQKFWDEL